MVFLLKQPKCTKTPALDWEQQNNSSGEEGVGAVALYSLLIHLAFPLFQFLWHRGSSRAGRWWEEVLVLTSTVVIWPLIAQMQSPLSLSLSLSFHVKHFLWIFWRFSLIPTSIPPLLFLLHPPWETGCSPLLTLYNVSSVPIHRTCTSHRPFVRKVSSSWQAFLLGRSLSMCLGLCFFQAFA